MPSTLRNTRQVGDSDNTLLAKLLMVMNEVADSLAAIDGSHSSVGVYTSESEAVGATFATMPANVADSFRLVNNTGTALEFRFGASGPVEAVPAGGSNTYPCVDNTNEWQWRRADQSNTQVTITGVFQK